MKKFLGLSVEKVEEMLKAQGSKYHKEFDEDGLVELYVLGVEGNECVLEFDAEGVCEYYVWGDFI